MPKTKEFSVRMEDEPGTLGKVCRALADREVNILAFQSIPWEEKSLIRFVVDNPTTAKSVLDTWRLKYTEAEVVQVPLFFLARPQPSNFGEVPHETALNPDHILILHIHVLRFWAGQWKTPDPLHRCRPR